MTQQNRQWAVRVFVAVLALTALDLLTDGELRRQARDSFEKQVPAFYRLNRQQ